MAGFFLIWGKGKDRAGEVSGGQRQGVLELDRGIAQHLQVDALLAGDQLLGAHEVHRGVDAFRRLEHAVEQPEDAELAAGRIAAYHGLIAFEGHPGDLQLVFVLIRPEPLYLALGLITAEQVCRSQARSEEHTSELQSRENLVCRLLLEKKKTLTGTSND